jgi:Glycosyltransferase family 87
MAAMAGARARRYLPAALTGALLAVAGFDISYWIGALRSSPLAQDSSIYYVAAQVGLAHGWNRIYDPTLQSQFLAGLHAGISDPRFFLYANPPPLAWLFAPLTVAPPLAAYLVFAAFSLAALLTAAILAASPSRWTRIVFVLGAIAWYPAIYSLRLGQVSVLVAALVVFGRWLDRRGWPALGGAILALAIIKPQLVLLVGPCLLIAGKRRMFAGWLLATLSLVVVSMLSLGASGLRQYAEMLGVVHAVAFNERFTLAALGAGDRLTMVLQGLAALLALGVAYRIRHQGTAVVMAVGLLGGVLAAPYLHVDDFAVLLPAAWFLLAEGRSTVQRLSLLPIALTTELAWVLGPLPILASLAISLLLFLVPRREQPSLALAA